MLNLSSGFNLNVLTSVDGRKVAEIRRASNTHDGTVSILRFRKKSEVPNIIVECDFDSYDDGRFFLQFENLKAEEIMSLYTMVCTLLDDYEVANAATSQDIVEWMISLKQMAKDGSPKLNAPEDIPELDANAPNIFGTTDPEEIARMMEEAMEAFENEEEEEDEEEDNSDMTEDQKFTADFFDFCEKDNLNFFRLLQMVDYLNVIKDETAEHLQRFNYLAFISLSFKYDEINGRKGNLSPSVKIWDTFHKYSKKVIGAAIGHYSVVQTIQSIMECLEGYKVRNWTKDDIDHIEELLDSMKTAAFADGIETVFDDPEVSDQDKFTVWLVENNLSSCISELYGVYSGDLYISDLVKYTEYKGDGEATAQSFIGYIEDFPHLTQSKLRKNENSN